MKEKNQITILVVDDEASLRKAIVFDLKRKGYNILEASNGKEGYDLVLANKIDVVLSDIRMPGGDGVELLERIKARDPELPVVMFITGFADLSLEDAYDKGADAVFSKPFERKALLEAIQRAVNNKDERWGHQRKNERIDVDLEINLMLPELNKAIQCRVLNIGRGGMFVALKENIPAIGSQTSFHIVFSEGDLSAIEGGGIVRWSRNASSEKGPSGCGIEFVSLSDEVRGKIIQLINQMKTKAFIPKA